MRTWSPKFYYNACVLGQHIISNFILTSTLLYRMFQMFENSKMLERVSGQEAMCNVTPVSEIEKSRREEKERNLGSYSYSIKLEENRLMVSLSYQSLI